MHAVIIRCAAIISFSAVICIFGILWLRKTKDIYSRSYLPAFLMAMIGGVFFLVGWLTLGLSCQKYNTLLVSYRQEVNGYHKKYKLRKVDTLQFFRSVSTIGSFDGGKHWVAYWNDGKAIADAKSVVCPDVRWTRVLMRSKPIEFTPAKKYDDDLDQLVAEAKWYRDRIHFVGIGSDIRLYSWDGGENYVAIGEKGEILGDPHRAFPNMLEFNPCWLDLREYVEKNGPIKRGDKKGIALLENARFVEKGALH